VVRFVRVSHGESKNDEMFRQTRKEIQKGKEQLRELLRSQKFRDCRLKDNFTSQVAAREYDLIVEISNMS
jgi:hypothetical protein